MLSEEHLKDMQKELNYIVKNMKSIQTRDEKPLEIAYLKILETSLHIRQKREAE